MNQDKLNALYVLATDERTPEEERRNAAVLYLKHAPKMREPTIEELRKVVTKEMFHSLFSAEIEEQRKAMAKEKTRADEAVKRAEKAEFDLRALKEAIRSARAAHEKIAGLVDEKPKVNPDNYRANSDFAKQINDIFTSGIPYTPGGYKW